MGPMSAAAVFAESLLRHDFVDDGVRLDVALYGSLALTGKGHATDRAILLGLMGHRPGSIDPDEAEKLVAAFRKSGKLLLGGRLQVCFDEARELRFLQRERLPFHSNAMMFSAIDGAEKVVLQRTYYSIGGGAILDQDEIGRNDFEIGGWDVPHAFSSAKDLLAFAHQYADGIAGVMRANEESHLEDTTVSWRLRAIYKAMSDCVDRGMATGGILPGGLSVKRRAPSVLASLRAREERSLSDPLSVIDWVNLWALAVNEENAAGGKVVTAPTNGAAGIIPAVMRYYERFVPTASTRGVEDFLLTAAAIGSLFKENASISGAEVGCQGEIGVACSMAAAGLTAAMGGTAAQVENAAEIGIEHNLGLTCDPVAGLVQIPCIERNAVGAIKAIEASRLALVGDGSHRVSLDQAIETMRRTGLDMSMHYKETSLGGLAVNVVEC